MSTAREIYSSPQAQATIHFNLRLQIRNTVERHNGQQQLAAEKDVDFFAESQLRRRQRRAYVREAYVFTIELGRGEVGAYFGLTLSDNRAP